MSFAIYYGTIVLWKKTRRFDEGAEKHMTFQRRKKISVDRFAWIMDAESKQLAFSAAAPLNIQPLLRLRTFIAFFPNVLSIIEYSFSSFLSVLFLLRVFKS